MIYYSENIEDDLQFFRLNRINKDNEYVSLEFITTNDFWDNPSYLFNSLLPSLIKWRDRVMTEEDIQILSPIKQFLTKDCVNLLTSILEQAIELQWHTTD